MCYVFADADAFGFALTGDEPMISPSWAAHKELPRHSSWTRSIPSSRASRHHSDSDRRPAAHPGRHGHIAQRRRLLARFIDRSPCGTGTSARLALMHARGQIAVGEPLCTIDHRREVRRNRRRDDDRRPPTRRSCRACRARRVITSVQQIGADQDHPFPTGSLYEDLDLDALTGARGAETRRSEPIG